MKTIILSVCFLLLPYFIYPQTDFNSLGPAPVDNNTNQNSVIPNDAAIGTRYFVQISSSPTFQFAKAVMENCTVTNIGSPFTITFPGGLVYRNGVVYTWNQSSPFQLWSIDTVTGTHTLVFNMIGVPQTNFTGMCWDGTTMYGVSTSITQSQIFTVNMTTGACIPLGTASATCAGAISLVGRIGSNNSLYSTDIVADNLYKWNKTTGVPTLVGPLGVNINFGQDGSVDPNDNTIYFCCYTTGPELRKLDTATGGLGPVLCTYNAQATGIACIPNGTVNGSQTTVCRGGLNIPIVNSSWAYDSMQVILGNGCNIIDVNVRIDTVLHTWDSDLSFYLSRNNGALSVKIINKVGSSGDNFIGTVLDDSAFIPIASGTAPFTGTYQPSNPLTPLNGTFTAGYWKLSITDTATGDTGILKRWCVVISYTCPTGGIQTIEIPNYYYLKQNYPNPFNPVTNIKFGIPESGTVRLVVYDITGRQVAELMNEYKYPGTYEAQFDGNNFASGIYFYSLETIRGTETKKMLLVK